MSNSIATRIFVIDEDNIDESYIREAASIIKEGGLLAFPTETVYGLGGDATDATAAARIYAAKGRPSDNPLIVHVSDMDMFYKVVSKRDEESLALAEKLAGAFWPGPLTLILEKGDLIPGQTTGGLDTVAVRMPSRRAARLIIEKAGIPVAAPSANISGRPSPTRAAHVIEDFYGRIEGIVDDGPSPIGLESTIIDLTVSPPAILRKGFIEKQDIEKVLGMPVTEGGNTVENKGPKAPGMKYRHYAPKASLTIVSGIRMTSAINEMVRKNKDKKTGVICVSENADLYASEKIYDVGSRDRGEEIMANIYAVLRSLDEDNIEVAFSEDFSEVSHGDAVMERLIKAAGGKILRDN